MIVIESEDKYSDWWNKLILESSVADNRYNVKGFFVWMPYGFSIMKNIRLKWDALFAENGIKEVYFPLLVPVDYAKKNSSWWASFQEQAFYVLGFADKEKELFLRPTGEPAMYPIFSNWIRSHRDLPLRVYETVSSFRNETKSTKTFVRDVEVGPWYEIHSCHATKEGAEEEIALAVKMNEEIYSDLAVAYLKVRKPLSDCFPGSVGAIEFYTAMNDKLVENASCNNLGQAYAKAYDIKFVDTDEKKKFVWQTCTGNGERFLSAVISNHSDDKGLVLPPKIAPIKAAIVIVGVKESEVFSKMNLLIPKSQVKVFVLEKFSEIGSARFETEKLGIPVRIEIGPKEMDLGKATVIFRNGGKSQVEFAKINAELTKGFDKLQDQLFDASKKELLKRVKECSSVEDAKKSMIAVVGWCGSVECADLLKHDLDKDLIGMTEKLEKKKCLHCGKEGEKTYFSKSY